MTVSQAHRAGGPAVAVGLVLALAAAALDDGWVFVVGVFLSWLGELALSGTRTDRALWRVGAGFDARCAARALLVIGAVVHYGPHGAVRIALLLAAVVVALAVRTVADVLDAAASRAQFGAVQWRNLEGAGPPPEAPRTVDRRILGGLDVVSAGAAVLSWPLGPSALVGGLAVVIAAAVAALAAPLRTCRGARRAPTVSQRNDRVHAALVDYAPQVAVYFSSPPQSTYALNAWLGLVDALSTRPVILLAEAWHLATLAPVRAPVLVVPGAQLDRFTVPSLRVVLYPSAVASNDDMLARGGLRHVLIGHGDSDKSVTASPLHRAFDETWVAGEAARQRYLAGDSGVTDEQIRIIGRPQLTVVTPRQDVPRPAYTVLYAPTWEGNFAASDYSSTASMGARIVASLLDGPLPVRVLLKVHPATGQRSRVARRARRDLERAVRAAGAPHAVIGAAPGALYDAMNGCDVMIADVSSVVPDFLASGKPYVVTDPRRLGAGGLRAESASAAGGYVLDADVGALGDLLRTALTDDPLARRRHELATFYLGRPVDFDAAVRDAVAAQSVRLGAA